MKTIEELKVLQKDMSTQLPKDMLNIMANSLSDMLTKNLNSHALKKGNIAPDFSLISTKKQKVNLYELLNTKPVIISFFRGSWCPFCVKELQHFQNNLKQLQQVSDVHFIAISPQKIEISAKLQQDNAIDFTILSDVGNHIAQQYGLVFTLPQNVRELYQNLGADIPKFNGDDSYQLPIPATYLIGQDKQILFSYINVNYMERVDISELVDVLKRS
ncbi:peroxiredoxin-like family protein [uncultured Gilliamella sp.]|uniref:peroxiredoxin-like family protein n=1 Tax=uncultured Gilliamella sp. TaxID=1193505 RepID=UPI0025D9C236|nr:peroxiredoxin-like family protein [uncultured Gilliamella sp.]